MVFRQICRHIPNWPPGSGAFGRWAERSPPLAGWGTLPAASSIVGVGPKARATRVETASLAAAEPEMSIARKMASALFPVIYGLSSSFGWA